jgi:pimeloyl-ACP methyl ester carboxylesterase
LHVCRVALAVEPLVPETRPATERDSEGRERLAYSASGYRYWSWRGHRISYVFFPPSADGGAESVEKQPFVLCHGFGAHAFHWRYSLPALAAAGHPTYALCLLGFGWSAKPAVDYSAQLWGELLSAFVEEVVRRPALIAGNSIGCLVCLSAAEQRPDLVSGLALLNSAGSLGTPPPTPPVAPAPGSTEALLAPLQAAFRRATVSVIFWSTQLRIRLILSQVYVNKAQCDELLAESIYRASTEPGALEAFQEISAAGGRSTRSLSQLLESSLKAGKPLALVWGLKDPWMTPTKLDELSSAYPGATVARLENAGHCPHDDDPDAANAALIGWAAALRVDAS